MFDFAALFESSPNPYMVLDRELRFVAMNQAYLQAVGRTREQLLGQPLFEAFPGAPDALGRANAQRLRESLQRVLDSGTGDVISLIRYSIARETEQGPTLEDRFWSATHTPLHDADGNVGYVLQHTVDVTELQQLKDELRRARSDRGLPLEQVESGVLFRARLAEDQNSQLDEQRRHLLKLFEQAPGFIAFLSGPEHVFDLANSAYRTLIGQRDVIGQTVRDALPEVADQGFVELLDRVYATGQAYVGRGIKAQLQTGADDTLTEATLDFVYQPVADADGSIIGIFVQGHDITEQAQAKADLERHRQKLEDLVQSRTRDLAERESELRSTELALAQSQKLEALGKLTGGVAHDFNNVLQVIRANLELINVRPGLDAATRKRIEAASEAVDSGATLASQLLTFARRQPLNPVVFDIGTRLASLHQMLQRLVGDGAHIRLRFEIDDAVGHVEADAHLFESMLLNLVINARDAMPEGGSLRLSCRQVEIGPSEDPELAPGAYHLLTLSDTGHGMASDVLERIFEPFFTTKPIGRGTGLGMPMAYGFVKQSGGGIRVHSTVGAGTRVDVHLPVSTRPATPVQPHRDDRPLRGNEVVLAVEDDPAVREGVVGMLRSLGYQVIEAADAAAALAMVERGTHVDLLFTDVVMPGILRSPDMAARARAHLPDLRVLFTSGYAAHELFQADRPEPGVELLVKPYRLEELAARVRDLLDAASQPAVDEADTGVPGEADRPLRVLLVDDCADTVLLTRELLHVLGHEVRTSSDPEHALDLLADGGFDLLLTDVELPKFSGMELLDRAREAAPALRAVLVSGHPADYLVERGARDPILQKPYQLQQLREAIAAGMAMPAEATAS